MKIFFCSSFLNNPDEVIKKSKIAPAISNHKFSKSISKGFNYKMKDDLIILNTENVASYPNYNKIVIKSSENTDDMVGKYFEIGKINLPIIKDISEMILLYSKLNNYIKISYHNDKIILCAYGRRLSHVVVINMLKKKYPKVKTSMILTDLSGNAIPQNTDRSLKLKIYDKLLNFRVDQSKKFDSFILITKHMYEYLNLTNKNYTVVEGIYDLEDYTVELLNVKHKNSNKIIAYTGILSRQYSVDLLIEAFTLIEYNDYELWIFGDGELKDYIIEISNKDRRIKFFGFLPNNDMREKVKECTVLVNPRQNKGDYVKYSFPSKIIEYMSLAKPVISYKLDGIPDEYDEYLIYPDSNDIKSLKEKIIEVCSYSEEKIHKIGKRNLEFVANSKNCFVQTEKIISMFEELFNKDAKNK